MIRTAGTNSRGGGFDAATIEAVWNRGAIVAGYDAAKFRKDACGAWMARASYGKTTDFGWEIDHMRPVSLGGGDELANLQPLQWQNNRSKSDVFPRYSCAVTATANKNVGVGGGR